MSNIADSNNEPPPVPPTVIPSVVDTLDPDLAAAYRSGNPTIIQAVNAGMTTNAMIVNEVIRMGGGMSGLPPAIQSMVTERQKEMAEQAAAENERLKKLAAGIIGMGMMASNIAQGGEYYGGEGNSRSAYETAAMKNYQENSASGDYWRNDFVELMRKDPALAQQIIVAEHTKAGEQTAEVKEHVKGRFSVDAVAERIKTFLTAEADNKDLMAKLMMPEADLICSKSGQEWLDKHSDKYYEFQLMMSDMTQAQIFEGLRGDGMRGRDASKHPAIRLLEEREELIRQMKDEEDPKKKEELARKYADFKDEHKDFLKLVDEKKLDEAVRLAASMDKKGAELAATAGVDQTRLHADRTSEMVARSKADTELAKTEVAALKTPATTQAATDGFDVEEPAAARPATVTASALGAGGSAGLAQLGATPATPEPANDPAPEVAQRKPAQPSQGMSA